MQLPALKWCFALIVSLSLLTSCRTTDHISVHHDKQQFYTYAGFPEITNYPNSLLVLLNEGYVAGYDEIRGVPAWVAYRVFKVDDYSTHPRPRRFLVDERSGNLISHDHYTNSGYDRGHMAPNFAIATRYGREAQLETFLMTNIIPQSPQLNREWWARVESLIARDYSKSFGEVWVITGPIFKEKGNWINNAVKIPSHNFMIIKVVVNSELWMMAFLVPQDIEGNEPLEPYLASVNEVEQLTGLNFNPLLSPDFADSIEKAIPLMLWHSE